MTTGETSAQRVNFALNAIRTIAAFLVVISHLRALFFVDFTDSESKSILVQGLYLLGSLGHPAVIVFFVLSGYWVGGAAIRGVSAGTFSWSLYGLARMTRLWLVLIPAIVLTQTLDRFGAAVSGSSTIYSGSSGYHTVIPAEGPLPTLGVTETIGNLVFVQSIHTATLGTNSPLWSLAYEFWYYALFPAVLVAFSRKFSRRARVLSGVLALAGAAVAGPAVLMMFPAWLLGAAVAWQKVRVAGFVSGLSPTVLLLVRTLAVLAVFCFSCIAVLGPSRFHGLELVVALPAAALLALFVVRSPNNAMLDPVSSAAEWSYSLYAIHVPVLALIASFIVPDVAGRWQLSPASAAGALVVLVVVSAVAYGMSLLTEANTATVRRRLAHGLRISGQLRVRA
jgi:peptidoglycan/LPS O-acetylase OafA/YrhL